MEKIPDQSNLSVQDVLPEGKDVNSIKDKVEPSADNVTIDDDKETSEMLVLALRECGFKNPSKLISSVPPMWHLDSKKIERRIEDLKERGFDDPVTMIEWLPTIIGLTTDNIDHKIQDLKERGFNDPIKTIESFPTILGYSIDNIDAKIAVLKWKGLSDPVNLIKRRPNILGYSLENLTSKIEDLENRGFDVVKLLEADPGAFGISIENIDKRIGELKERGFKNIEKIIERLPTIFGMTIENIDRRLSLYRKIVDLYHLPVDPVDMMENDTMLFSSKPDKVMILARVLREFNVLPEEFTPQMLTKLLVSNLENVLVALTESNPDEGVRKLFKKIDSVRKEKISIDKKRGIIGAMPKRLEKIRRDYFRGYPSDK